MPHNPPLNPKLEKAIEAFENAVANKAFEGTIPYFSDDAEEQKLLDAAHRRIKTNYTRTKNGIRNACAWLVYQAEYSRSKEN